LFLGSIPLAENKRELASPTGFAFLFITASLYKASQPRPINSSGDFITSYLGRSAWLLPNLTSVSINDFLAVPVLVVITTTPFAPVNHKWRLQQHLLIQ